MKVRVTRKQCRHCAIEGIGKLPVSEFHRKTGAYDGYSSACRRHTNVMRRRLYHRHSEDWKKLLSKKISERTGVPFPHVHTVITFIRKFRFENGQRDASAALRRWAAT